MKKMFLISSLLFAGVFGLVGAEAPQSCSSENFPNPLPITPQMEASILKFVGEFAQAQARQGKLTEAEESELGKIEKQLTEHGVIDIGDKEKQEIKACFKETGVYAFYPYMKRHIEAAIDETEGFISPLLADDCPVVEQRALIKKCVISRYPTRAWKKPVESEPSSELLTPVNPSESLTTIPSSAPVALGDKAAESPQS